MEILSLRFLVTEQDLNYLITRFLTLPPKIRDVRVRIATSGIALAGTFETFLPVPFETVWRLFSTDGKIAARLSSVKAVHIPLHFLKGYILQALISNSTLFHVQDETLVFDIDSLSHCAIPIKTNLTAIHLENGCLVLVCQREASERLT